MAYIRTEFVKNGYSVTAVRYYECDITGETICESDGWYGSNTIHISESGMEILIEDWIKRKSNSCGVPIILDYLSKRLTLRLSPNRYISKKTRKEVLDKYYHKCAYCGSTDRLEIDHIKPISKRGLSEFSNLQVLCKKCNLKKSNK